LIIGARTAKTGIAIMVSIGICNLLAIGPTILAAIAAMVNMQPSVYQSTKNAVDQVFVTGIGIVVGIFFGLVFGSGAVVIGIASIIVIYFTLKLKMNEFINIGVISTIFVLDASSADFLNQAFIRVQLIGVGLVTALVINNLIFPPKYFNQVQMKLKEIHNETMAIFEVEVTNFIENIGIDNKLNKLDDVQKQALELDDDLDVLQHEVQNKTGQVKRKYNMIHDLHHLNSQILSKVGILEDIHPNRLRRRAKRGNLPYTPEFQEIVTRIQNANNVIKENSILLQKAIIDGESIEGLKPVISLREPLHSRLEKWHQLHQGDNYHVRALMEVSIVIYELTWINKEQKRLFEKYFK